MLFPQATTIYNVTDRVRVTYSRSYFTYKSSSGRKGCDYKNKEIKPTVLKVFMDYINTDPTKVKD